MNGKPMARPDVYSQIQAPKAQNQVSMVAPFGAALNTLARGRGGKAAFVAAMDSPLASAATFSNPAGRLGQMRADMGYLRNARAADFVAGLPRLKRSSQRRKLCVQKQSAPMINAKRLGLLAAAIPTLTGAAYGTERIIDAMHNSQEEKRFRQLTVGGDGGSPLQLDPGLFGDRNTAAMDADALNDPSSASTSASSNLREYRRAFRDLNRVAPSVAKNPRLAASFLPGMVQGPMAIGAGTSADAYRKSIADAVRLENELQKSQNTLFDGISTANKVGLPRISG